MLVLAVIGVLYGALLAAVQTDMKRFVAYTSIAHFGFIGLGIFAFSSQSIAGSALYMVNHGISTAMLFFAVGMLATAAGRLGWATTAGSAASPRCSPGCSSLAGLSTSRCRAPTRSSGEFLVLLGSFPREPVFSVLATVGIVFAALYMLWVYQRAFTGPVRGTAVLADGPGAA